MTGTEPGLPPLDELAGQWIGRAELAHLPSVRNQIGQAHVNDDLASLSWLALPPLSVGYHTGVLRVDGSVRPTRRFRWSPWGVQRINDDGPVTVESDTRMGYERTTVMWRHTVTNTSLVSRKVRVEQELLAMSAVSEHDWGWLYGTPWNDGHYHDFFTTERLRAEVLRDHPRQVQLLAADPRPVRLGRPRNPGIQRDEDDEPMLMDTLLPDHTSPDSGRVRPNGVYAEISGIRARTDSELRWIGEETRRYELAPETEVRLDAVSLGAGTMFGFRLRSDRPGQSGVILTHGNHPDSLQFGFECGALWMRIGGESIRTDIAVDGAEWVSVAVTIDEFGAALWVDERVVGRTRLWADDQRWTAQVDGTGVVIRDTRSPATSAYAFSAEPTEMRSDGAQGMIAWELDLAPGEVVNLGVVLNLGADDSAVAAASLDAKQFNKAFSDVADQWRRIWQAAFTPGNTEFSGYLPTLRTDDPELSRTYYLGALLAIYMRNTAVSPLGPVFLTAGPRLGATVTFYWDQSEWARVAAMLEPEGMRRWIVAALGQPYESSHSFDTRNLVPVGNHYASNDHALFRTVQAYIGATDDLTILFEDVRGRSVLEHLREMAYRPRSTRAEFGGRVLADFGGDTWELLECVPNYRDSVVSFNAGYVGMLRSLATLLRKLGQEDEAISADRDADRLAAAVLQQYAGSGRWNIAHPSGQETIGHCLDFELVAADMSEWLSDETKGEMVGFVQDHLIDGDWMRALSPDDPIAPSSDRPDHGAAGAFAAWPGATAYGLCRLGRRDIAAGVLSRAHRATSGALWGQAMEAVGGGRFRVAERGVSNRDSNAAVAVTEAIIAGLFGIEAGFAELDVTAGATESEFGTLENVRVVGFDLPVSQAAVRPSGIGE